MLGSGWLRFRLGLDSGPGCLGLAFGTPLFLFLLVSCGQSAFAVACPPRGFGWLLFTNPRGEENRVIELEFKS